MKTKTNLLVAGMLAAGLAAAHAAPPNPANCVRVGGYDSGGFTHGVAVSGNYAYEYD